MLYSINADMGMPKYYYVAKGKVIVADNIAPFFGCQLAWEIRQWIGCG
jgi:hypothetical protein